MTDHGNLFGRRQLSTTPPKPRASIPSSLRMYVSSRAQDRSDTDVTTSRPALRKPGRLQEPHQDGFNRFLEGFYYKPRSTRTPRRHSKGLICLSACSAATSTKPSLNDKYDDARRRRTTIATSSAKTTSSSNPGPRPRSGQRLTRKSTALSSKTGIPLVATNDFALPLAATTPARTKF